MNSSTIFLHKPLSVHAARAILRLYTEWGVDATLTDSPFHYQRLSSKNQAIPVSIETVPTTPIPSQHTTNTPPSSSAENITQVIAQATSLAAQTNSLEDLHNVMAHFSLCSLQKTAIHTLAPQGPYNAPLMIIGGIPDADEDRNGQPFTGRCGMFLDEMLAYLPLSRDQIALATAIPWRPPGGRLTSDLEQHICLPFLQRAITLLAPQRLLLCGNIPLMMLFGHDTSVPRQRWHTLILPNNPKPLPTLSMTHPIQLHASATARREIWTSLMLVIHNLRENTPPDSSY